MLACFLHGRPQEVSLRCPGSYLSCSPRADGSLDFSTLQAPLIFSSVLARKDAGSAPGMHATAPALSTGVATTSPSTGSIMTLMDTAPMWLSRCDCGLLREEACPEIWKRVLGWEGPVFPHPGTHTLPGFVCVCVYVQTGQTTIPCALR